MEEDGAEGDFEGQNRAEDGTGDEADWVIASLETDYGALLLTKNFT